MNMGRSAQVSADESDVFIVGAGIGGLTAALELHRAGIPCRVVEAVDTFAPVGVGINILPHGAKLLGELGLEADLTARAVLTQESIFFNRFGQLIYREPCGRFAGYADPQYSIHRADLHDVLLTAVIRRLGPGAVLTGHRLESVLDDGNQVHLDISRNDSARTRLHGRAVIAADGINSVVRKQLFPREGPPRYSGVMMWRGVTVWPPLLTGASMIRAGWLSGGKMVIYPIRDDADELGRQLVNWVAEVETAQRAPRDWTRAGHLDDFALHFADWHFDWLDVPAMLAATENVLEYPMVDQDPLPRWSHGRITLLGDAAHPMVPRGSNGAGQAILDARAIAESLTAHPHDPAAAFIAYERRRRPATEAVVLTNRTSPPDAILREVYERTGDKPFDNLDDIVSVEELRDIADAYNQVAGVLRADRGDGT